MEENKDQRIQQNQINTVNITVKEEKPWKGAPYFYYVCLIFSVFYVFCLFDNPVGITYPIFTAGLLFLYLQLIKYQEEPLKKDSIFYMVSILLLAVSNCITDNQWIIFFNKVGIWLLFGILCLHNSYEDKKWRFTKYACNLCIFFFGIIENLFASIRQRKDWKKKKEEKSPSKMKYILMGLVIAMPLLVVIVSLLVSADAIFSNLVGRIFYVLFREIILPTKFIRILLMFLWGFLFFYSILYNISQKKLNSQQKDFRTKEPLIAITFLALIAVVYLIFCGIQISYIFTGGMELPSGYTYSSFARQGFFQLLFVCVLNLILVLMCLGLFRENRILKILLTFISGCTYIMIVSSAYRMMLYIVAYQLTRLRILVLAALLVLAILLGGVIRSIFQESFPLFKYSTIVVTVIYVILSLSRIDFIIAKYNVSQRGLDITYENQYITTLSADAAGIYVEAARSCDNKTELAEENLDQYFYVILDKPEIGVRNFNFSRYSGKKAADDYFLLKNE